MATDVLLNKIVFELNIFCYKWNGISPTIPVIVIHTVK